MSVTFTTSKDQQNAQDADRPLTWIQTGQKGDIEALSLHMPSMAAYGMIEELGYSPINTSDIAYPLTDVLPILEGRLKASENAETELSSQLIKLKTMIQSGMALGARTLIAC